MLRLLSWLRLLTAAATIIIIVLLCWQCIDIYLDGNAPQNLDANGLHLSSVYSMEIVSVRLSALAAPLIGCFILVIVTGILHSCFGTKPPKAAADASRENRLRMMKMQTDALPEAAIHEEKLRRRIRGVTAAVIIICSAGCLHYLLNEAHFLSWDLEMVIGNMLVFTLPWILVAFAAAGTASFLCKRSVLREIDSLKGTMGSKQPDITSGKRNHVNFARGILFMLSAAFIVLGVMNGGLYDVLVKAISICTECIGLG